MNVATTKPASDVPLPIAVAMLAGLAALFVVLRTPASRMATLGAWLAANDAALLWSGAAGLVNLAAACLVMARLFGAPKQGSHLRALTGAKAKRKSIAYGRAATAVLVATVAATLEQRLGAASPFWLSDLGAPGFDIGGLHYFLTANLAAAVFTASLWLLKVGQGVLRPLRRRTSALPMQPATRDSLVLGTDETDPSGPAWVSMSRKGLNGNILITGGIGSGKTQGAILPYLDQILSNFTESPAVLAIDPKGVFVKKALAIAAKHGLESQCLHMRLGGEVRYNPIYHPKVLKGSRAVEVAHMLKAAALNSAGRGSGDSFWDVSAFNLIKNAVVYCGAVFGYYTLNDLYRVLVKAAKADLAEDLSRVLALGRMDPEETFNVQQALTYFDCEFTQFEERVRTGILASSTAFLNQFNDYQACRIFCPREDEITIKSIDEAIDSGKIILFDVDNPALARSLGTILKLQFQDSLLKRLGDPERSMERAGVLIIDEYQDVVTSGRGASLGDESFLAKGREANGITIVATQSLTSLENALGSTKAAHELFQNFRTRLAGSTTDLATIRAFQEIAGQVERERESHSVSETSQDARANPFLGGYEAARATNISEGITTSTHKEHLIAAEDFARLTMFESFAQVFDGDSVTFRRLCLKPYFLGKNPGLHRKVLDAARKGAAAAFLAVFAVYGLAGNVAEGTPNLCDVVTSPAFETCTDVQISGCMCPGTPPRPCAQISYYRPETFIEVMANGGETFFAALPMAKGQLASVASQAALPYGATGEMDSHAYEAHVLDVPEASVAQNFLPCGSRIAERTCYDAMSEHLGELWTTGRADLTQPSFLAWAQSPKACITAGAAQGVTGGLADPGYTPQGGMCSVRMDAVRTFPPSSHAACTGWGTFFPRVGIYDGPSGAAAALMVAARIKSLGSEVFGSVARSPDEKWEMILPGPSMCFREGQNVGFLETIGGIQEITRLAHGPPKGFLFTIWRRVSCCRDFPEAAALRGELATLRASCAGGHGR